MIDCDKLIERKDLRKVVNRKKEAKRGKQEGRKDRDVKTFHSLRVTLSMDTRTTAALECEHLSL